MITGLLVDESFTTRAHVFDASKSADGLLDLRRGARAPTIAPAAPRIDHELFDDLLDVVGRSGRAEFLACLTRDLRETADSLYQAMARRDAGAAQRCGHALVGLAGTVGAAGLHDLARSLNEALRANRPDGARLLLTDVMAEVNELTVYYQSLAHTAQVA